MEDKEIFYKFQDSIINLYFFEKVNKQLLPQEISFK